MFASKSKLAGFLALLNLLVACSPEDVSAGTREADKAAQAEITALLNEYEVTLNAGDVAGTLKLYGSEPVVMTAERPASEGKAGVEGFYTATFQAISLKLDFKVAEIMVLGPEWAMLRSTSSGVMTIKANGAAIPSEFQELFVLRKEGGKWKFARYFFSSTTAPAK